MSTGGGPDEWLEMAKKCKYLSEGDMKRLCELVKECLMEGLYYPHPPLFLSLLPLPSSEASLFMTMSCKYFFKKIKGKN